MFGPERTGLRNEDVSLADAIINIPLNPEHCSLNLSQAVLLICYEFYKVYNIYPWNDMYIKEIDRVSVW